MAEASEKRGPIEKTESGWPINPVGVVALIIFGLVIIFLIVKPLLLQKAPSINEQVISKGGTITQPAAGDIIRSDTLPIELSADEPKKVAKVQFWVKTYADGKWNMIGEVSQAPYRLNWKIPPEYKNKAIAVTTHVVTTDGADIKDPGGWREGIIILNP